jgi:hypothetical protein
MHTRTQTHTRAEDRGTSAFKPTGGLVVPAPTAHTTCNNCGLAASKLLLCSRCKEVSRKANEAFGLCDPSIASYCSKECQVAHWKVHKKECGVPILHPATGVMVQQVNVYAGEVHSLMARGDFKKAVALGPRFIAAADSLAEKAAALPKEMGGPQLRQSCASVYAALAMVYAKLNMDEDEVAMRQRMFKVIPDDLMQTMAMMGCKIDPKSKKMGLKTDKSIKMSRLKDLEARCAAMKKLLVQQKTSGNVGTQANLTNKIAHTKLMIVLELGKSKLRAAGEIELLRDATQDFKDTLVLMGDSTEFGQMRLDVRMHVAVLEFKQGHEAAALEALKEHLSILVGLKRSKSSGLCAACGQCKDKETSMMTCGSCKVARFCDASHQKESWQEMYHSEGHVKYGGHKHVCKLLKRWRLVEHGDEAEEACQPDMIAFLKLSAASFLLRMDRRDLSSDDDVSSDDDNSDFSDDDEEEDSEKGILDGAEECSDDDDKLLAAKLPAPKLADSDDDIMLDGTGRRLPAKKPPAEKKKP